MSPRPYLLSVNFSATDAVSIVLIAVLIILSALFSASEMAFSSVNTIKVKSMAEERVKGARRAQYICEHFDFVLVCILVGNNLVNIANTTICAYLFAKLIVNATVANLINTVVMTILILIFGEIIPKAYAKHNPEKFVLKFSGLIFVFVKIIYILAWPFYKFQKLLIKNAEVSKISEDELEDIVDTMETQGTLDSENAEIIHSVIDLSEQTVFDIFVPRVDMLAIPITSSPDEIKEVFKENQFSRIPVYEGDKDNIKGILNFKDFFTAEYENETFDLEKLLTEPLKVSKTMKVDELIKLMKKEKKHIAIVIDEYGGTSGIVTMEDALEQVVGEIYDETDETAELLIQKISENKYYVEPELEIEKLFEILEIEHLPETNYSSVGGLIYELSESLPQVGTVVNLTVKDDVLDEKNNYITTTSTLTFTVDEMSDDRIERLVLDISREESMSNE